MKMQRNKNTLVVSVLCWGRNSHVIPNWLVVAVVGTIVTCFMVEKRPTYYYQRSIPMKLANTYRFIRITKSKNATHVRSHRTCACKLVSMNLLVHWLNTAPNLCEPRDSRANWAKKKLLEKFTSTYI